MNPLELRALTVRQPWAEAVAEGVKTVENRSQGFPQGFRGTLAIHAGLRWSTRGLTDPRILSTIGNVFGRVALGAVIALVDVVDIHPAAGCCAPWGEETYPPANPEGRAPGVVTHLVLENPRRVGPFHTRGKLGLWTPDEDLLAELVAS